MSCIQTYPAAPIETASQRLHKCNLEIILLLKTVNKSRINMLILKIVPLANDADAKMYSHAQITR